MFVSSFCVTTSAAGTSVAHWGLDTSWEVQVGSLEQTPLRSLWSSPQDLVLPVAPVATTGSPHLHDPLHLPWGSTPPYLNAPYLFLCEAVGAFCKHSGPLEGGMEQ